ncbi:hypothetical protein ACNOYE_10590 [Nannocystaceae bacterium ST9]
MPLARVRPSAAVSLMLVLACTSREPVPTDSPQGPSSMITPITPIAPVESPGVEPRPLPKGCELAQVDEAFERLATTGHREAVAGICADCRPQLCASYEVRLDVLARADDVDLRSFAKWAALLLEGCDDEVDACTLATKVIVTRDTSELPDELPTPRAGDDHDPLVDPERACQAGDARACYECSDVDIVMWGATRGIDSTTRALSLRYWQQACELEPLVYCAGLALAHSQGESATLTP